LRWIANPVTPDCRVKRLILKIELEAQLVAIAGNSSLKIIDKKLRGYPCRSVARSLAAVVISFPISIIRPDAAEPHKGEISKPHPLGGPQLPAFGNCRVRGGPSTVH